MLHTPSVVAQDSNEIYPVMSLSVFLESIAPPASDSSPAARVKQLINKVQPSVYYEQTAIKTYGQNPVCLYTDFASFAQLSNLDFPKADIELLTLRVKDLSNLSNSIETAQLEGYPKLKYIHILSDTNLDQNSIISAVVNNNPRVRVFYSIQKTR